MPENDGPEITLYRFRPPDSKIFDVVGSLSLLILTEVTVCEQTGMPFPYDVYTIQACNGNTTGIRLRKLILGKRTQFPHWYLALHQSPHWRENQRFHPVFSIPQGREKRY